MQRTAFIFAAGLGTRLKPLTDKMPKALVPYHGEPMLKSLILKLRESGFERIIINIHHFADMIEDYVRENHSFGLEILFSDERDLLRDTGGGIRHIASFFREEDAPFLVHNCDILSNIDLKEYYDSQVDGNALKGNSLVSLVVNRRTSSRYLLFDQQNQLRAWINNKTQEIKSPEEHFRTMAPEELFQELRPLAFNGIHILSPRIFSYMKAWPEQFSIIDFYLNLCAQESILCMEAPEGIRFKDIGKLSSLKD